MAEDIAALVAQADLPAIAAAFTELKQRGSEFQARCPFHQPDVHPSLSLYRKNEKWNYKCFSCGAAGDALDWIENLEGLDTAAALKRLNGGTQWKAVAPSKPAPAPLPDRITSKPPEGIASPHFTIRLLGEPELIFPLRDLDGSLLGYECRYKGPDGRKEIRMWTYGARGDAAPRWGCGHFNVPRPLYGLERLAELPEAQVQVFEGPKKADAGKRLLAGMPCLSWTGGAQAWHKHNWRPLKGRKVLLWPDADEPGWTTCEKLAALLSDPKGLACEVRLIDTNRMPEGWDVADAEAEGWDGRKLREWAKGRAKDWKLVEEQPPEPPSDAAGIEATNIPPEPGTSSERPKRRGPRAVLPEDEPAPPPPDAVIGPDGRVKVAAVDDLAEKRRQRAKEQRKSHPLYNLWREWGLQLSDTAGPIPNLRNAVTILECDPAYAKTIWFDEFLGRVLTGHGRDWTDADDVQFALHMQGEIGVTRIGVETASRGVISVAHNNVRNCVKDWLVTLRHDGGARVDSFFADFFGVEPTEYCIAASRNFWLSLAARILEPGCKVDNMIVLEGPQGVGKSKALKIIAGDWFAEQHESATNPKAFAEILQGKVLIEISEMDAFNRAEVNRVKQTISCSSDRFRASYGRYATDHPRTCIFVGTTNRDDWNRDETGARRFWPIACRGDIDLTGIATNRDQLLAEAASRFKNGEPYWEMPSAATSDEQRARYQHDSWAGEVERILLGRADVTTHEILKELGIETARQGRSEQMRVAAILRFLGWTRGRKRAKAHVGRPYLYFAPGSDC
jgi:putative DNA primase/helicase